MLDDSKDFQQSLGCLHVLGADVPHHTLVSAGLAVMLKHNELCKAMVRWFPSISGPRLVSHTASQSIPKQILNVASWAGPSELSGWVQLRWVSFIHFLIISLALNIRQYPAMSSLCQIL